MCKICRPQNLRWKLTNDETYPIIAASGKSKRAPEELLITKMHLEDFCVVNKCWTNLIQQNVCKCYSVLLKALQLRLKTAEQNNEHLRAQLEASIAQPEVVGFQVVSGNCWRWWSSSQAMTAALEEQVQIHQFKMNSSNTSFFLHAEISQDLQVWKTCFVKTRVMLALQFAFNTSTENPVTEEPVTEKLVSEKPVSHDIHIVLDVAALYVKVCWNIC